jgi:hypothetical protein
MVRIGGCCGRSVCVCTGEVRAPADPGQAGPDLVIGVAELIREPITD